MELYLVRHGETAANQRKVFQGWLDLPLNKTGQNQANWLSERLKNLQFSKIYYSPLIRAKETAELIREKMKISVEMIAETALKEINFGQWEGMSSEKIQESNPDKYQNWLADWQKYTLPDGESCQEMYQRVSKWLSKTLKTDQLKEEFLIVTHEGVILQMICYLLEIGLEKCWHFRVEPGSLTIIKITDGFATLTKLNETSFNYKKNRKGNRDE